MAHLSTSGQLGKELKTALKDADEIWIAVALMTEGGLKMIQKNLNKDCKQHYLLGVDLPTTPKALDVLMKQMLPGGYVIASIFSEQKEYYHPKVYIIRKDGEYIGFVGSANCTDGGLEKNIELTAIIRDEKECKKLVSWYEALENKGVRLSKKFIEGYKDLFEERKKQKRQDERKTRALKKQLTKDFQASMKERAKLIKKLRRYRNSYDYKSVRDTREEDVERIRASLDYPSFENIDLDTFYNIWDLGHLIPIYKPRVKRKINAFREMLKMLTNEKIDISARYDQTMKGEFKIDGVSEAVISKVLCIHQPESYCVINNKSKKTLKQYGIELPRGITTGQRYKAISHYLAEICREADIYNLAVLDYYLYLEANEK